MTLAEISRYYGEKLAAHGATPQGVDWNGGESQRLRFDQLMRLCEGEQSFSANDIGCGYGALFDHLAGLGKRCDYLGVDISPAMVAKAQELHPANSGCRFLVGERADRRADFAFASGIFNVKLATHAPTWRTHVFQTLEHIDAGALRGFAFNCLTKYSDADRQRSDLYYADPCELFDHCKRKFAKDVALLHDYGLYEFTILVRKSGSA